MIDGVFHYYLHPQHQQNFPDTLAFELPATRTPAAICGPTPSDSLLGPDVRIPWSTFQSRGEFVLKGGYCFESVN